MCRFHFDIFTLTACDGEATGREKVTKDKWYTLCVRVDTCAKGLVLIIRRTVVMVWHCWLAFHSLLHDVQSERGWCDCCLFIHSAGNGGEQAAQTKPQTLEHSGTLCCRRGSQSTPCFWWCRHIQALRLIMVQAVPSRKTYNSKPGKK